MRWVVKQHAVQRYLERIDGRPSSARVRQLLEAAGETAERLNQDTRDGASQYLCEALGCVAICREAHESGSEGRVMVSVHSLDMNNSAGRSFTLAQAFVYGEPEPILPHLPEDEPVWAELRREVRMFVGDYVLRTGLIRLPRLR